MTINSGNARLYGSKKDSVWMAPVGSLGPVDLAAPDLAFNNLGWLSPDGIDLEPEDSVEKFPGLQGGETVRTKMTSSDTTFKFIPYETTVLTEDLQYQVIDRTTASGITTVEIAPGRRVINRAWIIDLYDIHPVTGLEVHDRIYIPNGEVGERAAMKFSGSEITKYEITVTVIGNWFKISNDQAIAAPAGP